MTLARGHPRNTAALNFGLTITGGFDFAEWQWSATRSR